MKRRSLKQDKLAQVYDTEILPIWAERFGRMLLAEVRIPPKGLVLNVACGTGYPALDLLERMGDGRIIAIDSSSALLDVAREKAGALSGKRIFFRSEGGKEKLSFDDDVYDLTFSNLGIDEMEGAPAEALTELTRVTAPGGQLLVTLPLRGTWAEFLDIYREVLTKHDRHDALDLLVEYEATLPEPDEALRWMESAGLSRVDLVVDEFSLLFRSSREFFFAPVIELGPLRDWKRLAGKGQEMQDIFWYIKEAIDAYFGGRAFSVTVVAGCLSGWKPTEEERVETLARADSSEVHDSENPAVEVAESLRDLPEGLGSPGDDLGELDDSYDDSYDDAFAEDEDTLDRGVAVGGFRLSHLSAPVTVEERVRFGPPGDEAMDALVTHPRLPDSSIPLRMSDEVSIHELGEDDLEMLEEADLEEEVFPGEEPTGEEEVDTNVRRVDDLPDHLRRAIHDMEGEEER